MPHKPCCKHRAHQAHPDMREHIFNFTLTAAHCGIYIDTVQRNQPAIVGRMAFAFLSRPVPIALALQQIDLWPQRCHIYRAHGFELLLSWLLCPNAPEFREDPIASHAACDFLETLLLTLTNARFEPKGALAQLVYSLQSCKHVRFKPKGRRPNLHRLRGLSDTGRETLARHRGMSHNCDLLFVLREHQRGRHHAASLPHRPEQDVQVALLPVLAHDNHASTVRALKHPAAHGHTSHVKVDRELHLRQAGSCHRELKSKSSPAATASPLLASTPSPAGCHHPSRNTTCLLNRLSWQALQSSSQQAATMRLWI